MPCVALPHLGCGDPTADSSRDISKSCTDKGVPLRNHMRGEAPFLLSARRPRRRQGTVATGWGGAGRGYERALKRTRHETGSGFIEERQLEGAAGVLPVFRYGLHRVG